MRSETPQSRLSPAAMVLAAGFGLRMRPLTLAKPKPLLEVGGRTMLDHALDRLAAFGIRRAIVNAHYLADQIAAHCAARKDMEIVVVRETEILDTGGGIKNALPHFGGLPFFALNADLPWLDDPRSSGVAAPCPDVPIETAATRNSAVTPELRETDKAEPSLSRMAKLWNPETMDALLLMMEKSRARGFGNKGDFALDAEGRAHRKGVAPPQLTHVMLSAQILKPELFASRAEKIFSNNLIWDEAESKGRLSGVGHRGTCYHVGTPEDWRVANELLANGRGWGMA
jgi:MurNAc alpha-1-phosphate uridylyltransferase